MPSVALSECGATCGPYDVAGVVGGNVLRSFVVSFDYQGGAVVFGKAPPPATVAAVPFTVAFALEGGGTGTIAGGNGEQVDVPPTRIVIAASVEGVKRNLVVDTGASYTLLRQSLFDGLVMDGRATLPITAASANGATATTVTRSRALTVGAAASAGSPVAAVPDATVDNLSAETGTSIDGLLGGAFLRAYDTVADYPASTLDLYPYSTPDPLADEFVRVGVFLSPNGQGYTIVDVIPGNPAAAVDGLAGAMLVDVDGTSPNGLNPEAADRLLRGGAGTMHTLHFESNGGIMAATLAVSDVLPL